MSNYHEFYDEYFEPKETDQYIGKLQSLIEDIKLDVKGNIKCKINDYDKLKEAYDSLYNEKQSLSNDLRLLKKSLDEELKKVESKFKAQKIDEFFGDIITTIYRVNYTSKKHIKCNLCDEHREVEVSLPSGNKRKIACDCNEFIKTYTFDEEKLLYVEFRDKKPKWVRYSSEEDSFTVDLGNEKILKVFDPSIDQGGYGTYYDSKEEVQKHVDYLNAKERE